MKKDLSQNRLNPILMEEIKENKIKVKKNKKQTDKLDKTIKESVPPPINEEPGENEDINNNDKIKLQ